MTDIHAEPRKSKTLQHQLCSTTLAHIANRRKDDKDKYFSMLGYDMAMYTQHHEERERALGLVHSAQVAPPLIPET